MVVWGMIVALICLVNSYRGLVMYATHVVVYLLLILSSARFFLGLAEGGLFPGLTYYVSLWYPCQMQAKRVGFFTAFAALAGAFGGLLAYAIQHLEG